jgi:glycosyltransferase involved in cell wall biosynthesis
MLSIVVPYYNRENYLPRTLKSIAASDFRPLRLILVDNHSTDKSRTVCEQFAEQHCSDDFEIILAEEPLGGAARARNKGLALCSTPFVYFFDSDDEFDPHFLSAVIPLLSKDVDLLALTTKVSVNGASPVVRKYIETDAPAAQILTGHLSTQAMVLRTDFLHRIGGWNEQLPMWNDWELAVRVLCAKPRMRWINAPAFHIVFVHEDSLTGSSFSSRINQMRKAVKAVKDETDGSCSKALFFRMEFITGNLMKEKNTLEAEENKKLTRLWFQGESAVTRFFGFCIRRYIACGGRGSWKLAYWLCK